MRWLNPQYARVMFPKGESDYPLSVHCRAQGRFSAIPRESLSAKGGPTGCGCAMLNLASTLYWTYWSTAKKKTPSRDFSHTGWGEETQEKCKEIFWFLHTRVCERVRGAHHWSSGFNSKYIRTSFNTHRHQYLVSEED